MSLSSYILPAKETDYYALHAQFYGKLRAEFRLGSQMAQSVLKTVVARYKSLESNGHPWTQIVFGVPCAGPGLQLPEGLRFGRLRPRQAENAV